MTFLMRKTVTKIINTIKEAVYSVDSQQLIFLVVLRRADDLQLVQRQVAHHHGVEGHVGRR